MAEQGWRPRLPVMIVPGTASLIPPPPLELKGLTERVNALAGFGSTGLEVIEGFPKWKGERVWLSLSKISGQAISLKRSLPPFPLPPLSLARERLLISRVS